jgi:HPt (histidine-containing phosphotransfer) domain-containing protein
MSSLDSTLLDLDNTLQRLGGDRNLLACLANVFAEDAPQLVERLSSAVKSMRGDEIRSAAHALRGLAANFGAPSLTFTLRELEELGARDDTARAKELLQEVCRKTTELQNSLEAHR